MVAMGTVHTESKNSGLQHHPVSCVMGAKYITLINNVLLTTDIIKSESFHGFHLLLTVTTNSTFSILVDSGWQNE